MTQPATPNNERRSKAPRRNWQAKPSRFIEVVLSLLLIVVTATQAAIYFRQSGIMETQAGIAKSQLEATIAEQRPWVALEPTIISPFAYTDAGANLTVRFSLTNTGHSPALNVQLDGRMVLVKSHAHLLDIQKTICDELKKRPVGDEGAGIVLFPGSRPSLQDFQFSVAKAEIDQGVQELSGHHLIIPALIGCAEYFYPADKSQHETGFIYFVHHRPPFGLINIDLRDIPASDLLLLIFGEGSGRTN